MSSNNNILFYLGHPAHYHLFKHAIRYFGNRSVVVIKSKDVLEELLKSDGITYIKVEEPSKKSNTGSKVMLALRVLKRVKKLIGVINKSRPRIMAGSPAELALCGRLTGVPAYMFFEDDVEKVAPYGTLTGPMAAGLVCPDVCSAGSYHNKKTGYRGYHELAYLHPEHFTPDWELVKSVFNKGEKNFIIRFVDLGAFHDKGKSGITNDLASVLIDILKPHGKIHITSERTLPAEFEPYRISVSPSEIHHLLGFADMFIGDSQTMTAEAAVLGTPALRFNDFVGELSYLEDLEHRYQLTFGFKTHQQKELTEKLHELLKIKNTKQIWNERRSIMLHDKINVANWMISFLEEKIEKPV
jgi:uncharacterized protein